MKKMENRAGAERPSRGAVTEGGGRLLLTSTPDPRGLLDAPRINPSPTRASVSSGATEQSSG